MAQPRVFISSTYYDLKYLRASLEAFVVSLGFEPVLSEKGGVPYSPDRALDESCYREVQNCDIYVLIIGGRYGSEATSSKMHTKHDPLDPYESITKMEYRAALDRDMPIYILIERSVYSEYQTYVANRTNRDMKYAHVDNINIYRFIEEILGQPRNNPVQSFDRPSEIVEWLRLQWAGLFRELLQRMSSQQQIASLTEQVDGVAEINKTLRRYLEEVVTNVLPERAPTLIESESSRLAEASLDRDLRQNSIVRFLESRGVPIDFIRACLSQARTLLDFYDILDKHFEKSSTPSITSDLLRVLESRSTLEDINRARILVSRPRFSLTELTDLRANPRVARHGPPPDEN